MGEMGLSIQGAALMHRSAVWREGTPGEDRGTLSVGLGFFKILGIRFHKYITMSAQYGHLLSSQREVKFVLAECG